jgi:quercetin 2,3-dioxygenase
MNTVHSRDIQKVWSVQERNISAVHRAGAVLQPGYWEDFDPFLLLMEDQFQKGAFDIHPHRGMETITYIISGTINHYDNVTGEGGKLQSGDFQFMTAGRGVVHNESPGEGERVHLLQLWVNLPRKYKMVEPRYQNISKESAPVRHEDGALIRVYSGSSGSVKSNTLNYVPVTFVEMIIESGTTISQDLPGNYNGFIYVLEGSGSFGENHIQAKKGQALWLGAADFPQSLIKVTATDNLRLVLFAGVPLREPVVARGPFVMNTEEEIVQAYTDYRNGNFIS